MLECLDDDAQGSPHRASIVSALDEFIIHGPNDIHACCISQVGGPKISQLTNSLAQVAGSRRLHATLARKLAG